MCVCVLSVPSRGYALLKFDFLAHQCLECLSIHLRGGLVPYIIHLVHFPASWISWISSSPFTKIAPVLSRLYLRVPHHDFSTSAARKERKRKKIGPKFERRPTGYRCVLTGGYRRVSAGRVPARTNSKYATRGRARTRPNRVKFHLPARKLERGSLIARPPPPIPSRPSLRTPPGRENARQCPKLVPAPFVEIFLSSLSPWPFASKPRVLLP